MHRLAWRAYERLAMILGLGSLALLCLGSTPVFLMLLPLPQSLRRRLARRLIRLGFRAYLALLRGLCCVRISTQALDALRQTGTLIVVANHPSLLDAVILLAYLPNACCVLKAKLLRHPLFGLGARLAGYVGNADPRQMIEDSRQVLLQGAHFILFPEGTRTQQFPINRLGSACIVLSKQTRVPMQTVLLRYSTPYLGKTWKLSRPPDLPLIIDVQLGPQIEPPLYTNDALARLENCFRTALEAR